MATTFEPAVESAFSVRVLGTSIRLSLLETQTVLLLDPFQTLLAATGGVGSTGSLKISPGGDNSMSSGTAQYEPVFMQLADDHKYLKIHFQFNLLLTSLSL